MAYKITKVYTENPYVDEIVYYTKLLAYGTVLKNEQEAINDETVESRKASDLYISSIEGTVIFDMFTSYSATAMQTAGVPTNIIAIATSNKENIPESYRSAVIAAQAQEYIASYVELNNYYRMLHGLPNINDDGTVDNLYVTDWTPPSGVTIDLSIPVNEMDADSIEILNTYGVLDDLYEADTSSRHWIKHLQDSKIDYYTARKARRFEYLYIPSIDNATLYKDYKDKLELNRSYTLKTVYSEAFSYGSDYYDSFISVFIVLMSMTDLISRVQEYIARKEIFDLRSVKYLFESYGIPYFDDIPLKYQVNMVKNIHTLLKYKSTGQGMADICSIFGFNNVNIFKYYLLKYRNVSSEDGSYVYSDDNEKMYDLKFVKLPIDGKADDYIRKSSNYVDYDEITESDQSWDGGLEHDTVKKNILEQNFNYVRTKYMSIDSMYDTAKLTFQQCYFFNMLYDDVNIEDSMVVSIPYINTDHQFRLADVFTFLTVLTYRYNGLDDLILTTPTQVLTVNGFNFSADLATIATDLANMDDVPDEATAALQSFVLPESYSSIKSMMKIFVNNGNVRDSLLEGMRKADNMNIYRAYKMLYDALMITTLQFNYYKNSETNDYYYDSNGDITYTAFLQARDSYLYGAVNDIDSFTDEESRTQYIANLIDNTVYALEEYIDTDEYNGLFATLPLVSSEAIKTYIAEVIDFFKSYKVTFLGLNTIYTMGDDKFESWVRILEDPDIRPFYEKNQVIFLREMMQMKISLYPEDKVNLIERYYLDYNYS